MAVNYLIGSAPQFWVKFYDEDGNLADPVTVTLQIGRRDSGPVDTYTYAVDPEIIKESTGYYTAVITLNTEGFLVARWAGLGVVIATYETLLRVHASGLPGVP